MRKKISDPKTISDPSIKATIVPKGEFNDRWTILQSYGMPIPEHFIDEMREILRVWSDKETSLRMKDFLVENRIASRTFYSFVERSEKFKQEYEWTLAKIASRREIGAMTGKLHPIATRMMPRYDDEWTENEKKLEEIKKNRPAN